MTIFTSYKWLNDNFYKPQVVEWPFLQVTGGWMTIFYKLQMSIFRHYKRLHERFYKLQVVGWQFLQVTMGWMAIFYK